MQVVERADSRALTIAGKSSAARATMIAITTNISTSVKPRRPGGRRRLEIVRVRRGSMNMEIFLSSRKSLVIRIVRNAQTFGAGPMGRLSESNWRTAAAAGATSDCGVATKAF